MSDAAQTHAQGQAQRHEFQAEVRQILKLVVHSLYSHPEVFLRELISNAADACDKLRFDAIQDASLLQDDAELHVDIRVDRDARTLTISDNGIGMSEQEVIDNLGTIANSGTRRYLEQLTGDARKDTQLIGQFGVGFYSAFIVADKVTVETRRAGLAEDGAVRWQADEDGSYTLEPITRAARGTSVTLHLKESASEWLENYRLSQTIQRYSDHIGFPIRMFQPALDTSTDEEGSETPAENAEPSWETINQAQALWTLAKKDISEEQYQSFYRHLTHDSEAPLAWTHNKVEGRLNYTSLLYVPAHSPYDLLLNREERKGLKLYVRRVLIMDAAEQLLPYYLRFMRGVVDADDLPLNVSRELLQENENLGKIRAAVVKRSLDLLEKLAKDQSEDYLRFWRTFGPVLKEGVVEDFEQRERLTKLLRFHSTQDDAWISLDDYIGRMKEQQDCIWYLTAESEVAAKNSPQLEAFRKAGLEVLLLSDRVDEWMMGYLHEYEGKPLRSVAKGEVDLTAYESDEQRNARETQEKASEDVLKRMGEVLSEKVESVRASRRLAESAACLVTSEHAMALHLQRMLRQAGQEIPEQKPSLELNLDHPLVKKVIDTQDEDAFKDWTELLYEQAALVEGGSLREPTKFVERLNRLLLQS